MAAAKEEAIKKMKNIAIEEWNAKYQAEKTYENITNAILHLEKLREEKSSPENIKEYDDYIKRAEPYYETLYDKYTEKRGEYSQAFHNARVAGLSQEEVSAAAESAIAAYINTDIKIINEIFRTSLVGLNPIYSQEMVNKAKYEGVSVGIESKLMQLFRCLSVNISQELFYLTYRAIPDNTRLQSAIVYDFKTLKEQPARQRPVPPGVFIEIKKMIGSIGYESIDARTADNNKSYITYNHVPIEPKTVKLHEEITGNVKEKYDEDTKPSEIPLFFIFITPKGHASLIIYIPHSTTGIPKLFSFGLGFDGKGSGSAQSNVVTPLVTGGVQLYSPDFLVNPENGDYKLIDMGFLKKKHVDRINKYLGTALDNVDINLRNNAYINTENRSKIANEKEVLLNDGVVDQLKTYLRNGYLDSFAHRPAQRGGEKSDGYFHYLYSAIKLDKKYSYVSAGVGLTSDYVNCTSFLSHIFSDRITCGIRQTLDAVADPLQCVGYAALALNDELKRAYDTATRKTTKSIKNFFTRQPRSDREFREKYKSKMNSLFVAVFISLYLETSTSSRYDKQTFDYLNYEDRTMIQWLANCVGDACRHPFLSGTLATGAVAGAAALALHTLPRGGTRREKHKKNRRSTQRRT